VRMGHEISEEEKNTEKQIQGKSWSRKQRMSDLSNFCFAGFCHLRACISHTHTHTHKQYMDGRAFLTY
jgi:hypothetical protein